MFCIHCGKEIPNDAKFCIFCGQSCSTDNISGIGAEDQKQEHIDGLSNTTETTEEGTILCPNCGSTKCLPIVESSVQSSGGGYNCCSGGCGGVLLGPIGLLLGLCGSKQKISLTNQTRWVCSKCGKKFMSIDDAKAFAGNQGYQTIAGGILSAACGGFSFCYSLTLAKNMWWGEELKLAVAVCVSLMLLLYVIAAYVSYHKNTESNTGYSIDTLMSKEEISSWNIEYICAAVFAAIAGFVAAAVTGVGR